MFVKNSSAVMRKVLMSRPTYLQAAPINEIAKKWAGTRLDVEKMENEHLAMIEAYKTNGVEVVLLEANSNRPNAVFARDFGGCIKEGYLLGRFKETIRYEERAAYENIMQELGIPKVAEVKEGVFEGGDFTFVDDQTIAIGMVARSNEKGIQEIREALAPRGYEVIGVPCDEKYLHLDLCFNLVDEHLAVVYSAGLPEDFLKLLKEKHIEIIDVPAADIFKHGCNLQAIGNKRVISLKQNVYVNEALAKKGLKITEVDITEILKAGGGPHCMTFPLLRY